jgi:deoxyribose-phosphate aldolase
MSDSIARLIDHSLLHPTMTDAELRAGCELARRHGVASVCVKPYAVRLAAEILAGSEVRVGTVIGFPHGSNLTEVKAFEAEQACRQGATELDMVVNLGKLLSGDWQYVEADIQAVVQVARRHGAITKVIFENDYLPNDELKIRLCQVCERAGAEFVKTSTGYGFVKQPSGDYNYRGATEHDLKLMRAHCGPQVQVKAAGGVRTYAEAARVRELGVARIGASATEAILAGERAARGLPSQSAIPSEVSGY